MSNKMENETKMLTPIEFFEKLQEGKFDAPLPFSIIGLVKKSDGKEKTIEFASGGNCSNWITIPLEFIESVEVIRTVPYKDHSHPLAILNLMAPKTPEGKFYFAMLEGMKVGSKAMQQWFEEGANEFQRSNNSAVPQGFSNGFWGCTDTYCGCDNYLDCFLMGASGKCKGRKIICTRNGCVCIPRSQ